MQPFAPATWPRSAECILGSVAGGVLAMLLLQALPGQNALLVVICPVAAATIAFRRLNYTLFVVFLACLFVAVTELLQPGGGIPSARVINNIIGSVVGALVGLLLWPEHGPKTPGQVLADAVVADFAYAAGVIAAAATPETLDSLRRWPGIANSTAERMCHRTMLDGRSRRARLAEVRSLLAALRALAGATAAFALSTRRSDPANAAEITATCAQIAAALRDPSAAEPSMTGRPAATADGQSDDMDTAPSAITNAAEAYIVAVRTPQAPTANGPALTPDPSAAMIFSYRTKPCNARRPLYLSASGTTE